MSKDQIFFNTILRLGHKNRRFLFLLVFTSVIFLLPKGFFETVYAGYIYRLIRGGFHLLSWIPFPLVYFLFMAVPGWIYYLIKSQKSWKVLVLSHLKMILYLVMAFYWLWAFNYKRESFDSKFRISLPKLDSTALSQEMNYALASMVRQRGNHPEVLETPEIEKRIRPSVKAVCQTFGYNQPGKIRVKALYPEGCLLRIKTAGFYLPYTGEAYVDPGMHPIQLAFTIAHEMCHGYGVTDEGACNFLGYLATQLNQDSTIQYSGAMGYYRYVAGAYRYNFPEPYQIFRKQLPPAIQIDLDEINASLLKYPDLLPKLRDKIYDNYLKLQGIKEGMSSYDNIIDLVRQARKDGLLKE